MTQRVAFLLGAGASVDAGLPTASDLKRLFTDYHEHVPSPTGTRMQVFFHHLESLVARHMGIPTTSVNFEHLFGAIIDLLTAKDVPTTPALGTVDDFVKDVLDEDLLDESFEILFSLFRSSLQFDSAPSYLDQLEAFIPAGGQLDIFSLNYDLLIETHFASRGIRCCTGFTEVGKEWNPSSFDESEVRVRLCKLHGSLDWVLHQPLPKPPNASEPYVEEDALNEQYFDNQVRLVRLEEADEMEAVSPHHKSGFQVAMNFGVRKDRLYVQPPFPELWQRFRTSMATSELLVVVGYSFRDDYLNDLLLDALQRRKGDLQVLVVDPSTHVVRRNFAMLRLLERRRLVHMKNASFSSVCEGKGLANLISTMKPSAPAPAFVAKPPVPRSTPGPWNPGWSEDDVYKCAQALFRQLMCLRFHYRNRFPKKEEIPDQVPADLRKRIALRLKPLLLPIASICNLFPKFAVSMGRGKFEPEADWHLYRLGAQDAKSSERSPDAIKPEQFQACVAEGLNFGIAIVTGAAAEEWDPVVRRRKMTEQGMNIVAVVGEFLDAVDRKSAEVVGCLNAIYECAGLERPFPHREQFSI